MDGAGVEEGGGGGGCHSWSLRDITVTQGLQAGLQPPPPFSSKHQSVQLHFHLSHDLVLRTQFHLGGECLKARGKQEWGSASRLWSPVAGLSPPGGCAPKRRCSGLSGSAQFPSPELWGPPSRWPQARRPPGGGGALGSSPGARLAAGAGGLAARRGALRLRDLLIVLRKGRRGKRNETGRTTTELRQRSSRNGSLP